MSIKKAITCVFCAVLVHLTCNYAYADFYRFVDDEGVVHITNVPTSSKYRWMMNERKGPRIPAGLTRTSSGDYDAIIRDAASRYGIDPKLVKAIVKAESDFDAGAVFSKGAGGLRSYAGDFPAHGREGRPRP